LITPEGKPFFSIGLNHVDPATLRYAESGDIWEKKYQNSMENWLQAVHQDLADWGFNSLGWNQEVVTINDQNHRHSRSFTVEEYQWLDMPYCHMLPFIESHQWDIETRLPDIYSKGFEEWCDYVARDHCARMKDDPKLIGYFYTDCPTWVHNNSGTAWKAPLFDPEKLDTSNTTNESDASTSTTNTITNYSVTGTESRHGASALKVETAFAFSQTGTVNNPGGSFNMDGTGTGHGTFYVTQKGKYLGGMIERSAQLAITGAAPDAIPVSVDMTLNVSTMP
jgi:hypothetical protein